VLETENSLSTKKKLLFVVNSKNYTIFNRNSAIDSILFSILKELSINYDIYVNGKLVLLNTVYNASSINKLSGSSSLASKLPEVVKQFLRDIIVLKDTNYLFNQIKNTQKPDVIIELMRYGSNLGTRLKKYFNVPLIAYFDAPAVEENKYLKGTNSIFYPVISKLEAQTILEADKVIVYSEAIKTYWTDKIPKINQEKFSIFQTLDYTRLNFKWDKNISSHLTVGFVGSFLKWHRVHHLIEAYNKLRDEHQELELLLIGAGEEFESIKKLVDDSKWKNDITLTGFIDGERLKECRDKIDIGVMPGTHWYCMPTKVFEYGASGIISIAPTTNSIKCMFQDDEVVFLENNSATELYQKLQFVIHNLDDVKRRSEKLRTKIFKNNSLQVASAFYNRLIEDVINSKINTDRFI
jgi:glycosyltransferase involved in cell wall biosynthesis